MAAGRSKLLDYYIEEKAAFARPILRRLRKLVQTACPEAEETIKWGHATFLYRGRILCFMAAFKAHLGFGFWHHGMRKVVAADARRPGKARGLVGRITAMDDLPADAVILR